MSPALLLSVRFHDGRYHGTRDWPPSPARLFQALVAGVARGRTLSDKQRSALTWFEGLGAPVIAAPVARLGRQVLTFVPNNDLDAVDGDPSRVSEIRTGKVARPFLFDARNVLLYGWTFSADAAEEENARAICEAAEDLYQLGRGIDGAWAKGEVISAEEMERRLRDSGGVLHLPTHAEGTSESGGARDGRPRLLLCPIRGSLNSLVVRFEATLKRFEIGRQGRRAQALFAQPPKPRFRTIVYDSPPTRFLFELQAPKGKGDLRPWQQTDVVRLVEGIRTGIADRLRRALPDKSIVIDRLVVGQAAGDADKAARIRIVPLPSIGHEHADRQVRRVLIEVPANCPLPIDDIGWSCSGLGLSVIDTGEVTHVLVRGGDEKMLEHYGVDTRGRKVWRTVTPMALPQSSSRRRIDPERLRDAEEWKGAAERTVEERRAIGSVIQALRHADVPGIAQSIVVQREPFTGRGRRAEAFAVGTRFAKERLWHVEILFDSDVQGPIAIGDGRYLGLGLMAPELATRPSVFEFQLLAPAPIPVNERAALLHAVRRSLMALARDENDKVPLLFSGHGVEGGPSAGGGHEHVFLGAVDANGDDWLDRLIVVAPWACDRSVSVVRRDEAAFARVLESLREIRAGRLGIITLKVSETSAGLLGPARTWRSHTPYRPTRHAQRGKSPAEALVPDVIAECIRRRLPRPDVEVEQLDVGLKGGNVSARLGLRFATAVDGPLMLGRDSHRGGGLFEVSD